MENNSGVQKLLIKFGHAPVEPAHLTAITSRCKVDNTFIIDTRNKFIEEK